MFGEAVVMFRFITAFDHFFVIFFSQLYFLIQQTLNIPYLPLQKVSIIPNLPPAKPIMQLRVQRFRLMMRNILLLPQPNFLLVRPTLHYPTVYLVHAKLEQFKAPRVEGHWFGEFILQHLVVGEKDGAFRLDEAMFRFLFYDFFWENRNGRYVFQV